MAGESAADAARRMREKADRLARSAELWERGAEGERATAAILDSLPREQWTVFHDLRWPGRRYANVDHVVVGPPGVFVIDSKNWTGQVAVRNQVLRQNGRSRERDVAGAAEAALAVAAMTQVVPPHQVHPVLCFVRDEPVAGWSRDVMLCSTGNLAAMLGSRAAVIDEPTRQQLCMDLDASFRPATGFRELQGFSPRSRFQPPRNRSGPVTSNPRAARRRQSRSSRVPRLVATVVIVGTLWAVATSQVPEAFGRWFGEQVTSGLSTTTPPEEWVAERAGDPAATNSAVAGEWRGRYHCSRPASGRLTVKSVPGSTSETTAVFRFGPTPKGPTVQRGSYRLEGDLHNGVLTLTATEWIDRPAGYSMVDFSAPVTGPRPRTLVGDVISPGCGEFSFSRR